MGEISDALRRDRERQERERPDRDAPGADRFGTALATRILAEARAEQEPPRQDATAPLAGDEAKPLPTAPGAATAARQGVKIPRDKTGAWPARAVLIDRRGGHAESYRHFAIRVSRELARREARSVMVVSALRHEGKSTTSCNLALALASMSGGRRTALVDLDLRRPSIARYLEARPVRGIDDVLRGRIPLQEAVLATDIAALDLYTVSEPMSDPHELLAGPALRQMMAALEDAYDLVVIDSPPLLLVPDGHLLLPHVGGLVAVLRARQTRRLAFEQMIERIPDGKLIGTFVNDARMPRHAKQYGYYLDEAGPSAAEDAEA